MKLLVLAAFIAVVSSGNLSEPQQNVQWPWQTGKLYRYDVATHTLARHQEGASSGTAFKGQFIVRVKSPGRLQAKLENPQHAQIHEQLANDMAMPQNLKYEAVENLDQVFEISVEGGRVLSLTLPHTLLLSHENLLKGLISTLQVDLSAHSSTSNREDHLDREREQGLFKKMETDVTGNCETMYTVVPVAAEWRRELPQFASEEDPMEITKSKNYGHCHHRVAYHFGVPEGAEWTGTAHSNEEKQFISHSAVSRILVGKQGPIYKAETTSTVSVHPFIYGKQKAQVHSHVQLNLVSVEQDNIAEWQSPQSTRKINTLLYSLSTKQMAILEKTSTLLQSSESHEHLNNDETDGMKNRLHRAETQQYNTWNEDVSRSSSSDSLSAYVNDDVPNVNEPAYAALYMSVQSRGDKKQNTMNVQKLLQDMAQQLQNPNNMPKADFLSKFNILVRIIASMSSEQLAQISRGIEVGRSSNNNVKSDMWMIFRDAVVQAGTPPAFAQIKTWIKNKKLQNEEAAQVISSLARTLRYPSKEIMSQFFDLAMSPEVQQQQRLNTSALIAATRLIHMAHVNNETAHNYYPTHMYGRLTNKHDMFVLETILPRLAEKMNEAIEKQEWSRVQVYIKAIGNLGHPEILEVFSPYLEGRIQVPRFIRVQMVVQLRSLAKQHDKRVKVVLFSILKNTAEPYEVRVAAILNIFLAHPTVAMMQAMAQMTNDDPSVHVRSAIKSGIMSAANLKDPRFWHLSKTAQAVQEQLSPEDFGWRSSVKHFVDNYVRDDEQEYFRESSYISSDNDAMPKFQAYSWRSKISGWALENTIGSSLSDAKAILNFIKQIMYEPLKSNANHKHTAQKISEMLNIRPEPQDPLQGLFFYTILGQERFFSFDENDLITLVQDIMVYMSQVEKGMEQHYTKVFNSNQVSVMFPISSGMPFIYKYKEPVVIHLQAKYKGKIVRDANTRKEMSLLMDQDLQITAARNIDGNVGFMDTLSNKMASAGAVKKYQMNVPIKMSVQANSGETKIKVEPLRPDQDNTIAHYSVWPYTTIQMKDTLVPYSQDSATKIVERSRKVSSTDVKFGQQIGVLFQLQGYSHSNEFRNTNILQVVSNVANLLALRDIGLTHYNLKYLGKQSQNKKLTLTAAYDELFNQKQSGELKEARNIQDVTPNSEARRGEMVKRVSSGINSARAQVIDVSATLEGSQKQEYVFTAAVADSPVDRKMQMVWFVGRNSAQQGSEQINVVLKVKKPEISPLNFLEALKKDMKMTYEADIKFSQDGNIHIQGTTERTKMATEQLKNNPWAKLVQQQIENGNQYQAAAHRMLIRAHAPDNMKAIVTYKNLSPMTMNWTSQAFHILKQWNRNIEINPTKNVGEGKLQVEVQGSYLDNTLRFEMISPAGLVRVDNVPMPRFTPELVSLYTPFSPYERIGNYAGIGQYQPYCTIDGTKVKTFSNRSYDYELSPSWHLVMQEVSNQNRGVWNEMVILAKRPTQQQQEVYISFITETGKDLEIEIKPTQSKKVNVQVRTNSKKISDGDLTVYWDDVKEEPLLEYYTEADGVLMLNIRDGRLRAMYDGQRLVLTTQDHRKSTRGICGRNSGEARDDYQTPVGLVDLPELYGAAWALSDETSDPKTEELKKKAQEKAYQPTTKYTAILRSDEQWRMAVQEREQRLVSQNLYMTRGYQKKGRQCQVQQQIQYYNTDREICISTTPLAACPSNCRGVAFNVESAVVVCRSNTDEQFKTYRQQIQQGQNPQLSQVSHRVRNVNFRVPTSCKA
uniref:Vitellogenin n=1 Tax=Spodoptera exigua TaxID=7107 RepID=A0A0S3G570_SPOEX|nr:vitellogenin [Spodoptera exigua]